MTKKELTKKCVARGARLLDVLRPGWAKEINLNTLCMSDMECCVLGQLYGGYSSGCSSLNMDMGRRSERHGFERSDRVGYKRLRRRWMKEVEWRLKMVGACA